MFPSETLFRKVSNSGKTINYTYAYYVSPRDSGLSLLTPRIQEWVDAIDNMMATVPGYVPIKHEIVANKIKMKIDKKLILTPILASYFQESLRSSIIQKNGWDIEDGVITCNRLKGEKEGYLHYCLPIFAKVNWHKFYKKYVYPDFPDLWIRTDRYGYVGNTDGVHSSLGIYNTIQYMNGDPYPVRNTPRRVAWAAAKAFPEEADTLIDMFKINPDAYRVYE